MNDLHNEVILIFIKNPQLGQVKTRLADSVGPACALQIYQQLLELTQKVTAQIDCSRQLWYSQFIDKNDGWDSSQFEKKQQQGQDLGRRMGHAFEEAFAEGFERAVIIGSDCAELTAEIIQAAFSELKNHDVVIGPSQDGGYYLLGMKKRYPTLFEHIDWSTSTVYDDTVARIQELNLSYSNLPMLNDIDTEEDLRQSGERLQDL